MAVEVAPENNEDFPADLNKGWAIGLALFAFALLVLYYFPLLSGAADVYFSDISYYFEPFSRFVKENAARGILPLWNPMIYTGMPQTAMPAPGLFYPGSWFMFLLPFSCGLSCYMIFHQVLFGVGTYLFLRDIKASRAASTFAAIVVALCGYNFSFIRNFTLASSMAWFPIALYFERNIRLPGDIEGASGSQSTEASPGVDPSSVDSSSVDPSGVGATPCVAQSYRSTSGASSGWKKLLRSPLFNMLAFAVCVSMLMHVGRPEVGAPELLLLGIACISRPLIHFATRRKEKAEWIACAYKLSSLLLGLLLALPTIIPGVEWTALSPRAQGMALKYVFLWSANWFDFLCVVLSNPFGDLCRLDNHTMLYRQMVLSRGGHIPFLSSAYLSPLVVTLALWGLFERKNKYKSLAVFFLIGFSLMAAGSYTPFAPAIAGLSHFLSAFRYPVKLMIFPCLFLILLAVLGLDLLLQKKLSKKLVLSTAAFWGLCFLLSLAMLTIPEVGVIASKWKFLFHAPPPVKLLKEAQIFMGEALQVASLLGLLTCILVYITQIGRLKFRSCMVYLTIVTSLSLVISSLVFKNFTNGGYFNHPSRVANTIRDLKQKSASAALDLCGDSTDSQTHKMPKAGFFCNIEPSVAPFRFVNFFYDPLAVPRNYHLGPDSSYNEEFFQYSRELLLYQSVIDQGLHSSFGYEAAETADYHDFFTEAFNASCLHKRKADDKSPTSDAPLHRFAALTSTEYANTQIYRLEPRVDYKILDSKYFEIAAENEAMNFRIYRVKAPRPRAYFASNLVFLESFKDLQILLTTKESNEQARILDNSTDISYLLNRDKQKNSEFFAQIQQDQEGSIHSTGLGGPSSDTSGEEVKLTFDNGQELQFKTSTKYPRILVISNHFYPGWVAEVDGHESEILKANMVNQALMLPAGVHKIRVSYRPRSLILACFGAGAALLIFLAIYAAFTRWFINPGSGKHHHHKREL